MVKVNVKFHKINLINKFVWETTRCNFDIDLMSGRYLIDAKSIMGIYSLDLSKELQLVIHAPIEECGDFLDSIKFIVTSDIQEV